MTGRLQGLVLLTSSNQLYSGTGTILFDWIRQARHRIDFTLAIDTLDPSNALLAADVCARQGLRFHPGAPNLVPGCPDHGLRDTARLLAEKRWDFVECVSWASAGLHLDVLATIPPATPLLFTPLTQPLWTVGDPVRLFRVEPVFRRMLARADAIFCLSAIELDDLALPAEILRRAVTLEGGIDIARFRPNAAQTNAAQSGAAQPSAPQPGPAQSGAPAILTVCDFREHRKRPDLALRAFAGAARQDAALRFIAAGRHADTIALPAELDGRTTCLGYVGADALLALYQQASAFLLLSDFEAFGLPIAEALCCGTPVVITDNPHMRALFGGMPGVTLVRNTESAAAAAAILQAVQSPQPRQAIAAAAAARYDAAAIAARKLAHVEALCKARQNPR